MSPERWTYPAELGDALLALGIRPLASTPPAIVRDALNDLYRFELRRMRDRLRAGLIEKPDYLDRVVALRKKILAADVAAAGVGENLAGRTERREEASELKQRLKAVHEPESLTATGTKCDLH